ncbi:Pentatricopeptide repeat-containing protein 2, mitochondrial [Sphaceloma murrayae]|uniref:Pentatricopeptide repeat-containing protein 2, mitochondrial n=1 Tax=Sphaceloma murrayae TaxID=2082308 RepID=A0A2K1QHJ5_9PEZI|nr:Pentatricopeptide repeat-containing protein 2, mitochondrial [Sphaceloma murrayae]
MYRDYLKLFPGNFLEYHLSPNAVISSPTLVYPVEGVPRQLLKSMTRARMHAKQSRLAYLTLDTALRLLPASLSMGHFEDLIDHRPLTESFRLFQLGSRNIHSTRQDMVTAMFSNFRLLPLRNLDVYTIAVRACIRMIYVSLSYGHTPSSRNFADLTYMLLRLLHHDQITQQARQEIAATLWASIDSLIDLFDSHGAATSTICINYMLSAFGSQAGYKPAVLAILKLKADQQIANEKAGTTSATLLQTARTMQDQGLLRAAWAQYLNDFDERGSHDGVWLAFAEAACACDDVEFFETESKRLGRKEEGEDYLQKARSRILDRTVGGFSGGSDQSVGIAKLIKADLDVMTEQLKLGKGSKLKPWHIPPTLGYRPGFEGGCSTEEEMRTYYQQTAVDGSVVSVVATEGNAESEKSAHHGPIVAGRPVDELRYKDWMIINELLLESEYPDQEYEARRGMEELPNKKVGDERSYIMRKAMLRGLRQCQSFGLSDMLPSDQAMNPSLRWLIEGKPTMNIETVKRMRSVSM